MSIVLRRIIALLILTAYVSAAMFQFAPLAQAMPGEMSSGIVHDQEDPIEKMPCQGTVSPSPCVTDLGCIFLVGLPAVPSPTLLTATPWSSVSYPGALPTLHGRSIEPTLGPPIHFA